MALLRNIKVRDMNRNIIRFQSFQIVFSQKCILFRVASVRSELSQGRMTDGPNKQCRRNDFGDIFFVIS